MTHNWSTKKRANTIFVIYWLCTGILHFASRLWMFLKFLYKMLFLSQQFKIFRGGVVLMLFNVFHVRALYYTKTLITNKCTKRVLSSIVTQSYMFRPCRVIFREKFFVIVTLILHFIVEWECAVHCVLRCFWRREVSAETSRLQYTIHSQQHILTQL
jgi:hypothetical protein